MNMRYAFVAALVAPFMTVPSMAQEMLDQHVYQGGPKTTVPHATRPVTSESEAFAMAPTVLMPPARRSHRYNGGPQTVVPHSRY